MAYAAVEIDGIPLVWLKVFEVNVVPSSRTIGAPIETGEVAFDNKVIDPKQVIVSCTVVSDGFEDIHLGKIEQMFANREYQFYSVCDGAVTHDRLILQAQPYKRTSEKVDFYNFELKFVEAMIVQGSNQKSSNSENSNTRHGGNSPGVKV